MSDCAFTRSWPAAVLAVSIGCSSTAPAPAPAPADAGPFDLVIANGRVLDPESGLDGTRQLGLRGGTIVRISETPLDGTAILDAAGLAVAPGFVDLHVHGQDDENYRIKAMDGVTTALELEAGTEDVDGWYAARAGQSLINFGASSSHIRARAVEFHDKGVLLPSGPATHGLATPEQVDSMKARVRRGLQQGGLGVGMGIQYTPGATRWEIVEMFRVAAEAGAPVFVHVRSFGTREPGSSVESMLEVLAAAAITGAPLHIVHINSMSLESTPETLRLVEEARARGLDVTTEAYPYSAGQTYIESALLDQYENAPDDLYRKLQWVKTGERLTRGTFRKYRKEGGTRDPSPQHARDGGARGDQPAHRHRQRRRSASWEGPPATGRDLRSRPRLLRARDGGVVADGRCPEDDADAGAAARGDRGRVQEEGTDQRRG